MPKATTTPAVNRQIINSSNYALMRNKGFTNAEIEAMWMMPRQAIAAFQAWNTMGGKTWNDAEREMNTIHLGRRVCQNTFIPQDCVCEPETIQRDNCSVCEGTGLI